MDEREGGLFADADGSAIYSDRLAPVASSSVLRHRNDGVLTSRGRATYEDVFTRSHDFHPGVA
jgi:hypothetical protein